MSQVVDNQDEAPVTPTRRSGTSLALETYRRLRDDILNAELAPDSRLRIRELCVQYGAGLSPVREALNRLSADGWVIQSAQRGFTVASFSLQDLDEMVRTRRWIDEIGVRESILYGDRAWEEAVLLAYFRLSRIPRWHDETSSQRNPAWYDAHKAFHLSLINACRSEWLKNFSMTLFDGTERYRALSRLPGTRRSTHLDEHREITDRILERDVDGTLALLFAHYDRTAELVRSRLKKAEIALLGAGNKGGKPAKKTQKNSTT